MWLFIGTLGFAYWNIYRRHAPARHQRLFAALGLLTLWISLDWPVGALGAGYLASVHMVQFLLIALIAPPLLIRALPRAALERLGASAGAGALALLTRPVVALLAFHLIVVATHWPGLVDALMRSQAGSFAIDVAWLLGGTLFWWPVVSPVPARPRFPHGVRIGYLIASMVLMTLPYVFLTFAEVPFYATYELAPPVGPLSAEDDQRVAGLIMRLGGAAVLWTAAGILFWAWYRSESARDA